MSVNFGMIATKANAYLDIEASQLRDEIRLDEHYLTVTEAHRLFTLLKAALEYLGVEEP